MRTLEISEETYEKIKDQLTQDEQIELETFDDFVNGTWFFRTVTYHMVGKVTKRVGNLLRLEDASWIADSGRFADFIATGKASEAEPVGTCYINMQAVVDVYPWKHALPKDQV